MAVRAFVALELSEPLRAALAAAIARARGDAPGRVAWIAPANLHLTLAFLGSNAPEQLEVLARELDSLSARHPPFQLDLGSPGVFPSDRKPSILWLGVQPSPALAALQREVVDACRISGFELEPRPFVAHLTCARVKTAGPPGELAAAWAHAQPPQIAWPIDALALMRSDSGPRGVEYRRLRAFELRGPAPQ